MGSPGPIPAWASSWDEPLFQEFLSALRSSLKRDLEVVDRGLKFADEVESMVNLAAVCRHMAPKHWPRAIEGHFGRIRRLAEEVAALDARKDMKDVLPNLRIQMFPERFQDTEEGRTAYAIPVAPGLSAVLATDSGDGVPSVLGEEAQSWGASTEALFRAAARNHERRKMRVEKTPRFQVSILIAEDPYAASEMLFLDHYIPKEPPAGALVVVPTRQAMILHEAKDDGVMEALQTMIVVAHGMYQEGPGGLLPAMYWWSRGKFSLLPLELEGEQLRFSPPVEFVVALEKIGVSLS